HAAGASWFTLSRIAGECAERHRREAGEGEAGKKGDKMAAVLETSRHREGWRGAEFDRSALYWDFKPAHLAAIDELMARLADDPRPFHEITKRDFSHPALDADLATLLAYIKTGPGLVV